jgi:hypothetical protein
MRAIHSLILVAASACSLSVDTGVIQCSEDSDCDRFGSNLACHDHLCGFGPPGCFEGAPTNEAQLATQCTSSQAFQFNNCSRLNMCDDSSLAAAFKINAPPVDLGPVAPPVIRQVRPTVMCASVAPNLIYVTGSTNLPPLLKAVQPMLSANDPPYVTIFAPQTSCKGAGSILDADDTKHIIKNTDNNYAFYYDAAGVQQLCLLAEPDGNVVDVGESDVYPASCGFNPVPGTTDYPGPIQAIAFVVPAASNQRVISAEAAHLLFGAGGAGPSGLVMPWADPHLYFTRSSGTGTTQLVARSITVDPAMMWGIDRLSAGNLVASMEAVDPNVAEKAIGLLSSDFADKSSENLRVLAYQQRGLKYGYLPDSSPDTRDKANVRDGHYPIWGAIHLMAATQNSVPTPAASALITQFKNARLEQPLVSAIIESGFVPLCAMKVNRTSELGPLTTFKPDFGCGCFFDHEVTGVTSCKTCSVASECPSSAPKCNYGYCEVQ